MTSAEEAGHAIEAVNSWAASSGTGFGGFPILVRYADTPEEKARCVPARLDPKPGRAHAETLHGCILAPTELPC